jgi:hypothetical protein
MPFEGQVFDLKVSATVGPWRQGQHPGLVLTRAFPGGKDSPFVVVPMTGSRPPFARPTHVEMTTPCGDLSSPMWILCEYPTTLAATDFEQNKYRGSLPISLVATVRNKLGWLLRVPPSETG